MLPELTQETEKVLPELAQETKRMLPELAQETEKVLLEIISRPLIGQKLATLRGGDDQ